MRERAAGSRHRGRASELEIGPSQVQHSASVTGSTPTVICRTPNPSRPCRGPKISVSIRKSVLYGICTGILTGTLHGYGTGPGEHPSHLPSPDILLCPDSWFEKPFIPAQSHSCASLPEPFSRPASATAKPAHPSHSFILFPPCSSYPNNSENQPLRPTQKMDFHLARAMDALGADVLLRRRNLQNLLSALTSHEIRDLGKYAAEVDFRTDIFGRLPMELRLEIAEYLDAADLFNFLNVSRTWREAWSHSSMINLFMPGFLEDHHRKDAMASSGQDVQALFYKKCQRYSARCRGKYQYGLAEVLARLPEGNRQYSDTNFAVDTEYHQRTNRWKSPTSWSELISPLADSGFRNLLYYDGRVVWQPEFARSNNSLIIVDSLESQLRKEYTIPEAVIRGGEAKLMALGDKLVVASLDRTLHAWDLETNEHCSVTLPSSTIFCKTYGKQVYIYRHHLADRPGRVPVLHIYTWTFKGFLRELNTAPLLNAIGAPSQQPEKQLPWYCTGIIPHPLLDETIYVVCELGRTISLHKYTRGIHTACLSFIIPKEVEPPRQMQLSMRLTRLNPYGKYLIAVCESRDGQSHSTVCFDLTSEAFSMEKYLTPVKDNVRGSYTTWWDSLVTSFTFDSAQIYLEIARKGGRATREERIRKGLIPKEHGMAGCPIFLVRPRPVDAQLIFADDDFIVIRRSYGYLALSLRTKFRKINPGSFLWAADEVDTGEGLWPSEVRGCRGDCGCPQHVLGFWRE